jgi:hypothetical protein
MLKSRGLLNAGKWLNEGRMKRLELLTLLSSFKNSRESVFNN